MSRINWTREELILAFNLYLKIPFGRMHKGNAEIIYLSKLINRTPDAVAMRLSNFASIDPYHQSHGVTGLSGGRKQCQPIWDEFIQDKELLLFESERILAAKENILIEDKYSWIIKDISHLKGEEKIREIKTRINQNVFRQIILSAYQNKCSISGIDIRELLVASHIIPWSKNTVERLNPENGLCLSVLYDKAFDKGLIGINSDYRILLSKRVTSHFNKEYYNTYFGNVEGRQIGFSGKYKPKKEFLEYHLDVVFDR